MTEERKFYERAKKQRLSGEHSDCSVIATSIVCRVPYNHAHKALASQGRRCGGGAYLSWTLSAARGLGCKVDSIPFGKQKNGSGWTAASIGKRFPRGYYLVSMKGHIAALVNGEMQDWTDGRRHRVLSVYKVTVPKGSRS